MSSWLMRLIVLAGCLAFGVPVSAQTWETQALVNEAHKLTPDDLATLRQQAEKGAARAQVLMGLAQEMGAAGLMPDSVKALSWFRKAADQGVAWAKIWAGDFYYTGSIGVPRDLYEAMTLYRSAADQGDANAAFLVGQMYFFGDGVVTNQREAATWFRRAIPMEPALIGRLASLADAPCETSFCVSLRQVLGAVLSSSAERYAGEWDDSTHEWDATQELPDSDRCGFTSADRTKMGGIANYFCDSETIADRGVGVAAAKRLADDVAGALPSDWSRTDDTEAREGPVSLFSKDGYPRVRVSYNVTPGSAPQRVTLLIGP